MKTWDVNVRGRAHRVELATSEATGKRFVRVDGRIAAKPFDGLDGNFDVDIDGETWTVRVRGADGSVEKSAVQPAAGEPIGHVTVCAAGLDRIAICDSAILKITVADSNAIAAQMAGGLLGRFAYDKLKEAMRDDRTGPVIRRFSDLDHEVETRLGNLPFDLIKVFDDLDLASKVLVIPRSAVLGTALVRGFALETKQQKEKGEKPHLFKIAEKEIHSVRNHLCAAGYAMHPVEIERADPAARHERETGSRSKPAPAAPPRPAAPAPAPPPGVRSVGTAPAKPVADGIRRVKPTRILVADLGGDIVLQALAEEDTKRITPFYPRTRYRKGLKIRHLVDEIQKKDYDALYLLAQWDDKGRIKDTGAMITLKDLLVPCKEAGVRMIWIAAPNDPAAVADTLDWGSGLELNVVVTRERNAAYFAFLEQTLGAMAQGTAVGAAWQQVKSSSADFAGMILSGPGSVVFVPIL